MSRAYRIQLSRDVSRTIHVEDGVATELPTLEVEDPAAIVQRLTAELLERGFEENDEGLLVRVEDDGIEVSVDPQTGKVSVKLAAEAQIEISERGEVRSYNPSDEEAKARLEKQLDGRVDRRTEMEEERLRAKVTEHLEGRLADLREELNRIANKVTADGVKAWAQRMGEVIEVQEDEESGSVSIKVEV